MIIDWVDPMNHGFIPSTDTTAHTNLATVVFDVLTRQISTTGMILSTPTRHSTGSHDHIFSLHWKALGLTLSFKDGSKFLMKTLCQDCMNG